MLNCCSIIHDRLFHSCMVCDRLFHTSIVRDRLFHTSIVRNTLFHTSVMRDRLVILLLCAKASSYLYGAWRTFHTSLLPFYFISLWCMTDYFILLWWAMVRDKWHTSIVRGGLFLLVWYLSSSYLCGAWQKISYLYSTWQTISYLYGAWQTSSYLCGA